MNVLGQDLYRAALEEHCLEPFAVAALGMEDAAAPLLDRANILKAIRFGLSGIALHGWQNEIMEPVEQPFGDYALAHRFVESDYFPVHDSTLIGEREGIEIWEQATLTTQGETALDTIATGLQQSAKAYLEQDKTVEGIPLSDVFATIKTHVLRGRDLGLDQIPDAYNVDEPFYEDFFSTKDKANTDIDVIARLSTTTRNPIRFTSRTIKVLMQHFAPIYSTNGDLRIYPHPAESREFSYDAHKVATSLTETVRVIIRASQRREGTLVVVDSESETSNKLPVFVLEKSDGSGPEVYWMTKEWKPIPTLEPGSTPPAHGHYNITKRNKCPIGYTPDASSPMPIRKISDGIVYYLFEHGLHDPVAFQQPKTVY